jgi:hypothetical protein
MVEEKKSGGSNTWMWVIGIIVVLVCGCAICGIVSLGGLGFAGVSVLDEAIKEAPVYTESLARAKANSEVVAALGEPIQDTFNIFDGTSQYNINNDDIDASLSIQLSGPNGTGTLLVVGEAKDGGSWVYTTMEVQLSNGTTVNLLTP